MRRIRKPAFLKKITTIPEPVRRGIVFAAVILVSILPAVFMNSMYGYLPLLAVLFLTGISWGCLQFLARHLSAGSEVSDVTCIRGSAAPLGLNIVNNSRIICPKAVANLQISDLFGENDSTEEIPFAIGSHGQVAFSLEMDMSHIGVYSIGMKSIILYDFLGLFTREAKLDGMFQAFVLPRIRVLEKTYANMEFDTETSQETRVSVIGGTDYTGVREYELGDPMKQIHWKLSAHSSEYMTKIQESNRMQKFSVILDFAADRNESREQLMDLNDALIEIALSLIDDISKGDASFELLFADRNKNVVNTAPQGREDDLELLRSFSVITQEPGKDFPDASLILRQESRMLNRSSNPIVVTSRLTEELMQEMKSVRSQQRFPELYYIVPAEWNSRQIEQKEVQLKGLDDYNIPYYMISTADNYLKGDEGA